MSSDNSPFGDQKVNYPAKVAMKVIAYSRYSDEERESAIEGVLKELNLTGGDKKRKISNGGVYVSHSFTTVIASTEQLETLYSKLRELELVKMLL